MPDPVVKPCPTENTTYERGGKERGRRPDQCGRHEHTIETQFLHDVTRPMRKNPRAGSTHRLSTWPGQRHTFLAEPRVRRLPAAQHKSGRANRAPRQRSPREGKRMHDRVRHLPASAGEPPEELSMPPRPRGRPGAALPVRVTPAPA